MFCPCLFVTIGTLIKLSLSVTINIIVVSIHLCSSSTVPTSTTPSYISPTDHTTSYPGTNPLPISIRRTVSCGSFIQDTLSEHEKHYYLFTNEYDNELNINISTCPTGYYSEFDTDLTIYDTDMNELNYADGGCSDWRALLQQTIGSPRR